MVLGNSRREVECTAEKGLREILEWGKRNRLSFASQKTYGLLTKGYLGRGRNPTIKMGDSNIHMDNATNLGVVLDNS